MIAVQQNGSALRHIGEPLRTDNEVILAAVRQCGDALRFVPRGSRSHNIILNAVRVNGAALRFAVDATDDRARWASLSLDNVTIEMVLAAVQQNGSVLKLLPPIFKHDRQVVATALSSFPQALQDVSDELRGDKEIVLGAVRRLGWAVRYAAPELMADREVAVAAVMGRFGQALQFLPAAMQADRDVVLRAVRNNTTDFRYASWDLQLDPEVRAAAGKPQFTRRQICCQRARRTMTSISSLGVVFE